MKRNLTYLLLIFLAIIISGCTTLRPIPTEHVLMFDKRGHPVDPIGNIGENLHSNLLEYKEYEADNYEKHINEIKDAIKKHSSKKLIFFIHGGLNTKVSSLKRVVDEVENGKTRVKIMEEAGYFPIFINWNSSLISSYFLEHLFYLRQGKESSLALGLLTSPFVFATDIGRGILRLPIVSANLLMNDIETFPSFQSKDIINVEKVAKELECLKNNDNKSNIALCVKLLELKKLPACYRFKFDSTPATNLPKGKIAYKDYFPVTLGEDDRNCSEMTNNFMDWIITSPVKMTISPALIDSLGTSSWDVMLRRTSLLFHPENESTSLIPEINDKQGLSLFFDELSKLINEDKDKDKWEITLVGHSMGAIVANQIIREFGDLPIKKIIYLSAADTIQNYEDTVYPYLKKNKDTKIYHFVLHPISEREESNALDWSPRGSLLVWIDNFLSKPLSVQQRTAGRYDNLLLALHNAPTEIRNQIYLRVFSAGKSEHNTNPQTHGEIGNRFKFWNDDCLKEDANLQNCVFPSEEN